MVQQFAPELVEGIESDPDAPQRIQPPLHDKPLRRGAIEKIRHRRR